MHICWTGFQTTGRMCSRINYSQSTCFNHWWCWRMLQSRAPGNCICSFLPLRWHLLMYFMVTLSPLLKRKVKSISPSYVTIVYLHLGSLSADLWHHIVLRLVLMFQISSPGSSQNTCVVYIWFLVLPTCTWKCNGICFLKCCQAFVLLSPLQHLFGPCSQEWSFSVLGCHSTTS